VGLGEGRARIDGGADPTDVIDQFGLGDVEDVEEYDTVAGYVIGKLGRIPETGEIVRLGSAELEVAETAEQRVTSIELRVVGSGPTADEPTENGKSASPDTD
jgi:CBS domain containing-hemolysin-like protein